MLSPSPIRLTLADDHRLVLDSMAMLIGTQPDMQIISRARCGRETQQCLLDNPDVDILVVDYKMPGNTLALLEELKRLYRALKIIVVTGLENSHILAQIENSGVDALFEKRRDSAQLLDMIRAVYRGVASASAPRYESELPSLSKREQQILNLIAQGYSNPQIAEQLRRSPKTVDAHRQNLMRKLDVRSVAELIRVAINSGIIE